jgi:hypothetical protein
LYAQVSGQVTDFDSYLTQPGTVDVFFPTNFAAAQRLWERAKPSNRPARRGRVERMPNRTFMTLYAELARTKTMTTFNPLMDDFQNTAFLLAEAG